MHTIDTRFDALVPADIAERAEDVGVARAQLTAPVTFVLAILGGAFIALGAVLATTVSAGAADLPYGVGRLLIGLAFCVGLILVVAAGAELFTGNNLIVIAWAGGRLSLRRVLRNWTIVFAGNLAGAVATAALMYVSGQYLAGEGAVGRAALHLALGKVELGFVQAVALGMLCNALVCLAVWLTLSARSLTDKILAIVFPITAFVAAGFEHSVANMYFVPIALFIKAFATADAWAQLGMAAASVDGLTWTAFVARNLVPVTLGNIIGGAGMVGAVYWFVYRRPSRRDRRRDAGDLQETRCRYLL
jgi:formate transporter